METSLYVHIPFCKKKCDYCDFYSIAEADRLGKSNDLTDSYINALISECKIYTELYAVSKWNTVYIGGGTPSLLSSNQIINLLSGIKKNAEFSENCEITLEVNPDDVTEELIDSCKKAGINRISMGIQTLDDKALSLVNRGSSVEIILSALDKFQKYWNGRLSVDFIAGLPCLTWEKFENQFAVLKDYPKIDHVSLYTLTVEENTPLWKKIEDGKIKFSSEKADRMWIKGRKILESLGFYQYEISNFSKKGFESRHNSVYWKQKSYIGIGSGASGTVYNFSQKTAVRWTNTLSIPAYIKSVSSGKLNRNIENLDEKTLEFEFLMLGFRMLEGISSLEYTKRFGKNLEERLNNPDNKNLFCVWEKHGLSKTVKTKNGDTVYSLTSKGILLLNRFLEEFI